MLRTGPIHTHTSVLHPGETRKKKTVGVEMEQTEGKIEKVAMLLFVFCFSLPLEIYQRDCMSFFC